MESCFDMPSDQDESLRKIKLNVECNALEQSLGLLDVTQQDICLLHELLDYVGQNHAS